MNAARDWRDDVYDVLVEECRAPDREMDRLDFKAHWPRCVEYRFMGALGFGGKVWARSGGRVDVSCYPEDVTPERESMILNACERLAHLPTNPSFLKDQTGGSER